MPRRSSGFSITRMSVNAHPVAEKSFRWVRIRLCSSQSLICSADILKQNTDFCEAFLRLISDAVIAVFLHKTVQLSEDPCYTWSRSGLIESPYIPAIRTRFVQPGKIEIDANERAVIEEFKAAFSFAPPSIISLTICRDMSITIYYLKNAIL